MKVLVVGAVEVVESLEGVLDGVAVDEVEQDAQAQAVIKQAAAAGKLVAAVCAAPTALEAAGLLKSKRATAYPGSALPSATFVEERVVEDGNIVTSRGPGTTMAFALKLVERLSGPSVAKTTAERLLAP